MRPSSLAAVVIALAVVLPAAAQETPAPPQKNYRIFGQLTSYLELNQTNPNGDYTKFKQLASVNVEWSRFTVGAQLEYLYWSDSELIDPLDLDRLRDGFDLRRYFFDYQSDLFSGRLGTYFASFGRGLTLYVQKNEALQLDEPIHGAIARLTTKHVDVTVLGGQVTEPIQQIQHGEEFEDKVYGAHVYARLPLDFYVGGSAVRADLDRFLPEGKDEVETWAIEAGVSSLGGFLDLAAEISEVEKTEGAREKQGHGRYYSATAYVGPFQILAEYKDYSNFDYRYNEPPDAGRSNEAYDNDDVLGPRLLVSAEFWSIGSLIHASYASFNTHKTPTSPGGTSGDAQTEWYGGWEQTIGRVYFEASYFSRDFIDRKIDESHTNGDFHVRVGSSGEIIVGYDQRLESSKFFRLETTRSNIGYSVSPWGTVTVRYSYKDEWTRVAQRRDEFWGVEVQYLPKPSLVVTVYGGGDPGGLVCSGGQCRIEPEFEGFRANFTWRF